jgi:hypothetical protein
MEGDLGGFIYVGQSLRSNVSKIGFTTRCDSEAYIIARYGGLLEIQHLMVVSHAWQAKTLVQFAHRQYKLKVFRLQELHVSGSATL